MIEESLLKSNFIGRDGFRWWIGQIPPIEAWSEQADGKGWGHRYKVRILGYHPYDDNRLPDDDLPWAGVMMPVTAGSGAANFASSARVRPGDIVIGFFLDGDNAQIPMIMGTFGRSSYVPSSESSSPFVPFTGYTTNIPKKASTVLSANEETSQSANAQKSPVGLSPEQATKKQEQAAEGKPAEVPDSKQNGKSSSPANTCTDSFADGVTNVLENLLSLTNETTDFLGDVQSAVKKIQNLVNGLVGKMMNALYNKLIPLLQSGLENLYNDVFNSVFTATKDFAKATLEAIGAQKEMGSPVKNLQDNMICVASKVVSGIGETIKQMLESSIMEVVNFGVCAAEQFIGGLVNKVIDSIVSGLSSALEGISKILDPAFKVADFLRSSADVIKSIGGFLSCEQTNNGKCNIVKKWTFGYGAKNRQEINQTFNNIVNHMNNIVNLGEQSSPFTKPDCGKPSDCGPPSLTFFGGSGSGAKGKAILGSFINNTPGLSEVTSSITRTASIIGVEITDPGSGYQTAPPLISFEDPCNNGYGANGRAIVDYNENSSTYGQITGVYLISEGENYPGNVDDEEYSVDDTYVLRSGSGYSSGDDAVDDNGNKYSLSIDNGRIVSATPINKVKVNTLPRITVNSTTGDGALLKPLLGRFAPQGEVVQVIDCV